MGSVNKSKPALLRFANWSLATKLLVVLGLIVLVPLFVIGWHGYSVARRSVLENQIHALTHRAENVAFYLDLLLAERQTNICVLAEDPALRTFSASWPETSPEVRAAAQKELENLVQANPYFYIARLLNIDGKVILSTADEIGEDYSFRPYFQNALSGTPYISDLSLSVDIGQPVIYFSSPVRDDGGEVVGVTVLRVLAGEIWSLVEAEKDAIGPGSAAVLFDEYGLRLAHSSDTSTIFNSVVPLDPRVEARLLTERRLGTRMTIESTNLPKLAEGIRLAESRPYFTYQLSVSGKMYHAGAARMSGKPWTVVEMLSEDTFLYPVNRLRRTTNLALGSGMLVALLAIVLVSRSIVRPLHDITEAAQRWGKGELDHTLTGYRILREDEIGVLAQIFESMRIDLQGTYAKLYHMATHDPLTNLPNRALYYDRLDHALSLAKRNDRRLAVLFLDLDGFKSINDSFGHLQGDMLLQMVAERLKECSRESDTVARIGGDEFAFILENLLNIQHAAVVSEKILARLSHPFVKNASTMEISASIGISVYPDDGEDVEVLLKNADCAMYRGKELGKNCFQFY